MNFLEVFTALSGGGNVLLIGQWIFSARAQRKKDNALARQEVANSVDKSQEILDKMTVRLDRELDKCYKRIDVLEKLVDSYKKQCSTCPNNNI